MGSFVATGAWALLEHGAEILTGERDGVARPLVGEWVMRTHILGDPIEVRVEWLATVAGPALHLRAPAGWSRWFTSAVGRGP